MKPLLQLPDLSQLTLACHSLPSEDEIVSNGCKKWVLEWVLERGSICGTTKGFSRPQHPSHIFKLKKALYGLKQAPRAWYEKLTEFLVSNGFTRGSVDKTLFINMEKGDIWIAHVYVDNIVFGGTSEVLVQKFPSTMANEFEMSLVGELSFFLGLQVKQTKKGVFVSQTKYPRNLLKKFGWNSPKHARTPMSTTTKVSVDSAGKDVNNTLYRSMIGSLLYLTTSRPDIAYSVGVCARYQSSPKESHIRSVKRIFKYISGIVDYGIWMTCDTNTDVVGFSDADWVGCVDDRKSTSGGSFLVGNDPVAWHGKK